MPMAGGTAKTRFCQAPTAWYGLSMHATSNAGIGTGKCIEFQNQKRFSSFSRLASAKNAWYGYISSQPSQPGGVSMEYGLGNAPTDVDAVNVCPLLVAGCVSRGRGTPVRPCIHETLGRRRFTRATGAKPGTRTSEWAGGP